MARTILSQTAGRTPANERATSLRAEVYFLIGVILLMFPSRVAAGDEQVWTSVEYTALHLGSVKWTVNGGFRFQDGVQDLYDRRAGTIVEAGLGKGARISFGYMARYRDYLPLIPPRWDHRAVVGLSYSVYSGMKWALTGYSAYERFMGLPIVPDYNRYRQRFLLGMKKTGWSPLLYQDFAFLQHSGFSRSRSRAGLQWASASGYKLSVAYQFETTNVPGTSIWLPRHTVVTSFDIDKPIWKSQRKSEPPTE